MKTICYNMNNCKGSLLCAVSHGSDDCFVVKTICYKLHSCKVSLQCAVSHGSEGCFVVKMICYNMNSCKVSRQCASSYGSENVLKNSSSFFTLTTLTWISLECAVSCVSEGCCFVKTICHKMNSCTVSLQCAVSHDSEGCF
jgi:hypothetical protein